MGLDGYGRHVWDQIMNDPIYDSPDDPDKAYSFHMDNSRPFFDSLGGRLPVAPSFSSPEEVRSKAAATSEKVLNNWELLDHIVERHEGTIQRRWTKKTKEKRKSILLTVWPEMSPSHRLDFGAFKRKPAGQKVDSRRELYMWPYINLEDLLKSKLFLLLLNARGRNKPHAFAKADIEACHFGLTSGALVPGFLNEHVIMFTGRHTPSTYGELIAWSDNPNAFNWLASQRGHQPGEGLLILEIQDRLYKFLLDCCKVMLQDMSEEELANPRVARQPEPLSVSGNETGLASLASTAAEAPYRLPADLDLKQLESLVAAKLSAAGDHIWALREDPAYYAHTVFDWKEHRQELIRDTNGRKHPILNSPAHERIFWERVIGNTVTTVFVMMEMWGSLHEQIVKLQDLKDKYSNDISPEQDLPEDYALAFYRLSYHLKQFTKGPIGVLKVGVVASPPMRPYFVRIPQDPTNTKIKVTKRTDLATDKSRDEVI